ncbi:hypothetical protein F2Q68_00020568 [Brassica cretica]|uniref:Uncharacterized protein n=1 Tax=Brassica cretica TaxID=69181 RepID=A0A8S9FT78_BRACR|nr:hypothetical protein F2Q68_00020568 [Brassica cretica]
MKGYLKLKCNIMHGKVVSSTICSWSTNSLTTSIIADAPQIYAPRIVDPDQDDATTTETADSSFFFVTKTADSSTKDKSGGFNDDYTDLKPAGETENELKQSVHELEPAEESVHELKPAEVRVDELDELSELSDTSLELNELSDTEDGTDLVAGRN